MVKYLIGSARIGENGKATGGIGGDQTKKEVCEEDFYIHKQGWNILRAKQFKHQELLALLMKKACDNNNIGYNQAKRNEVITYGINTNRKINCDCSSLVRAIVRDAMGVDPTNFTTQTEKTKLLKTGFFDDIGEYTQNTELKAGDILITKTKGHTAIVTKVKAEIKEDPNIYFPKYIGSSNSIIDILMSYSVNMSMTNRKSIALRNNINNYIGSASQNMELVNLAKNGRLKK